MYLIDINSLQKFDSNGMYKVYDIWPQIAREQYETYLEPVDFGKVSHIVFAGMGGSGAIGDIFSAILSKTNIHVDVIKGYLLPKTVNSESLVITTSISGNTEETLSILKQASKLKSKTISFSNGGEMQKICEEKKLNYRKIKMIHSPRASFPVILFSMLKVFEPFLPIEKKDIIDSINELEKQREKISSNNLSDNNPAIDLAEWINHIPLIYYPWGLEAAATRFKNSLQENSKMHAMTENVIEAGHNGIVSWDKPSNILPILIQGEDDHHKTKERWMILKEFFEMKNIDFKEINSIKGSILSKLINLIYLLDYATIYKSVLLEIDPSPVKPIDYIKEKLDYS
jgi:glucose/mannose-6-phosphate isomerase